MLPFERIILVKTNLKDLKLGEVHIPVIKNKFKFLN
ncbi:MAG: hypothetical protein ACI85O_003631 [Saprospiraceae bacterium]